MFALSWIEIKHKERHCQWEIPYNHIYYLYKEKLKGKKQRNCGIGIEKITKAIEENKLTENMLKMNVWSKKWCQFWTCSGKQSVIWLTLCCLSTILAIGWEIRILNFIEIVQYFSIKEFIVR